MAIGTLVRSLENNLGIGKVIEIENQIATVEYFCSVGQRVTEKFPLNSLRHVKLQRQTKCYLKAPNENLWYIGRIYALDEETGHYQIDLPDSKTVLVSEVKIYVRCNLPIHNPMDILAMKGHETPYFHNCRSRFVKSLIQQRAISRGMSGLISANIALYPHQVEVVRRILEDPIQKYLLLDEVGLGKTIEAGVILRQFLLDEPSKKALILAPPNLIHQWRCELEDKFYLSQFPNRVLIAAISPGSHIPELPEDLDFLIIDEAHQLAAMATSTEKNQKEFFERAKTLAHRCNNLLLLSGTACVYKLREFLVLLHLLDPISYHLQDLDAFEKKLEHLSQLNQIVLGLQTDLEPSVLKAKLIELQQFLTDDSYLQQLIDASINDGAPIQAIVKHVSQTYRLHRRILGNRRISVEDVIFERKATPKLEYDLDERSYELHELLEQWRLAAKNDGYASVFKLLVSASSTWSEVFKQVLEARLNGSNLTFLATDFTPTEIKIITKTPQFEGETEILQKMLDLVKTPSEDGDRLELLKILLLYHLAEILSLQSLKRNLAQLQDKTKLRLQRPLPEDKFPKIIIFTSFTQTAIAIVKYLKEVFGENTLVSHSFQDTQETIEANIKKFKSEAQCFLMVCDRSGELGSNFQFADEFIHFDLPFSVNSIEQRLGRFDRIGGKPEVTSWLLVGNDLPDSYQAAWYELLDKSFNIFNSSVASLQHYLEQKSEAFFKIMLISGGQGILDIIEEVKKEIAEELSKLNQSSILDGIDLKDEQAKEYFENLEDYDTNHQKLEKATEGWLCNALRFARTNEVNLADVRTYQRTPKTLLSVDDLKNYFGTCLQQKGVFNRRLANQYPGIHLYRLGNQLIESSGNYMAWDDRGRAFALWRLEENVDNTPAKEWLGFRFDYLIETDLSKVEGIIKQLSLNYANEKMLRRRGDILFPPFLKTICLNLDLTLVTDEELLKIILKPYSRNHDYNLAKERAPIINKFVPKNQWENLCRQAQETAEKLLTESEDLQNLTKVQTQAAKQKLELNLSQLKQRLKTNNQRELFKEVQLENAISKGLLEGITQPRLIPDSVGFIVISSTPPTE